MQNETNSDCGMMVVVMATVAVGLTVSIVGPIAGPILLAVLGGGLLGVVVSGSMEEEGAGENTPLW